MWRSVVIHWHGLPDVYWQETSLLGPCDYLFLVYIEVTKKAYGDKRKAQKFKLASQFLMIM